MKSLRWWITILIVWLIFFFNIERITSPVNIRSYTYIYVAIVAALALVLPRLPRLPFLVLLIIPIPVFLFFKALIERGDWHYNLLAGYALPLTVTQISAIVLTGLLARQIHKGLAEFEGTITHITFNHVGKLPESFSEAQGPMYREVKRARRYQRPLTVIALKVDNQAVQAALPQIVKDVQQAMMQQFVLAGIAHVLDDNMHDFDTIALRGNDFIIVLPELSAEEAPLVAQRLEKVVKEKMNINPQIGTASFPNEAVTFESLIELAVANADRPSQDQTDPKVVYTTHHNAKTVVLSQKENS